MPGLGLRGAGPQPRAVTTEWLVTLLRLGGLVTFALIGWLTRPPGNFARLALLSLLAFGGMVELAATWALWAGKVRRNLPRYQFRFLLVDLFLLVGLASATNLFRTGLLAFFLFLIIIIALRAGLRGSLVIGPLVGLAYLVTTLLRSGPSGPPPGFLLLLDALGLVSLATFCGWFSEGTTRAWRAVDDITRQLEETRRQLEVFRSMHVSQKGLPSFMGHELRTPLTGIIGFTDLLLLGEVGPLSDRQREFLDIILVKSEELLSRIDNVMDIYRTQFGRMTLLLGIHPPEEVVEAAAASLAGRAQRAGVEIRRTAPAEPFPMVTCDHEKVKRVLVSLLDNALRNAPRGSAVQVAMQRVHDPALASRFPNIMVNAEAVRISVTEAGPRVEAGVREHLFDLFPAAGQAGAGAPPYQDNVGLATAREIVGLHWGRMWFEETPEGNTIRFTLPVNPLRIEQKIALVTSRFSLEPLLEGLLLQFREEVERKQLTISRLGWPSQDAEPLQITADKQLLQCVLFNLLNNNIRYAFPGSDIIFEVATPRGGEKVIIRFSNYGDDIDPQTLAQFLRGDGKGALNEDLRQVNVNLTLARDIIESHQGRLLLVNRPHQGVSVTIELPLGTADAPPARRKP